MSPLQAALNDRPQQPILAITTSRNWVLPPRPKNARRAKASDKKKKLVPAASAPSKLTLPKHQAPTMPVRTSTSVPKQCSPAPNPSTIDDLQLSIREIDRENYQLKTRLLSLIHDYKALRALVLHTAPSEASPTASLYDSATTARKRLFTEMGEDHLDEQLPELGDPMSELILDMNELSYKSPGSELHLELETTAIDTQLFDFVNLDSDFEEADELADGEIDDELDSQSLSRSISPSASENEDNLLMTSLTRSTTVSTNNSTFEKKPVLFFKFHDLPAYSDNKYAFSFEDIDPHDKMMAVIEEDHYNQVADFLEEKLLSNDVKYYVEKNTLLEYNR